MQRLTPHRQAVVDTLKTQHLMSAKDVVLALEKSENFANKTTTYRALEYLVETGLVSKIQLIGVDAQYEMVDEPHDHLVCTSCGEVEKTRPFTDPVTHIGQFQVKERHVTYYGFCKKCAKDSGKRSFGSILGL